MSDPLSEVRASGWWSQGRGRPTERGMTLMSHEYDGGQCWCGPKCDPVEWVPVHDIVSTSVGVTCGKCGEFLGDQFRPGDGLHLMLLHVSRGICDGRKETPCPTES